MSPIEISGVAFACIFGGAILGLALHALLPGHHTSAESKSTVSVAMGLVATMAALVLGLLVASAKGSYDAQRAELIQLSANVVLLDRVLAHYGPESSSARDALRAAIVTTRDRIWPPEGVAAQQLVPTGAAGGEPLYDQVRNLAPHGDAQTAIRSEAISMVTSLGQTRWLMFEQGGSSIPTPFLVVLVSWLAILFASFGLFAPTNATVIGALLVSSLSVSGALFLILEIDQPFAGLIQISPEPLTKALAQLGH